MAGEGELVGGREDTDAHVCVGTGRRQNEHGLREVHLARERLHRDRVEIARVGEDRQLVPCQRGVGEDVGDDVAEDAHRPTLT